MQNIAIENISTWIWIENMMKCYMEISSIIKLQLFLFDIKLICINWDFITGFFGNSSFKNQVSHIVRAVREVRVVFGSNSSKSTKFGTHIDYTLLFQILMGAKKRVPWDRHHSDVMDGRHLEWPPPVIFKLNQALNYKIRFWPYPIIRCSD